MLKDIPPQWVATGAWTLAVTLVAVIGGASNLEALLQEQIEMAHGGLVGLLVILKFILTNPWGLFLDWVIGLAGIFKRL